MRIGSLITASFTTLAVLTVPGAASAQTSAGASAEPQRTPQAAPAQELPTPSEATMPEGWWNSSIDVGVRTTGTGGDDPAWFERYRDLRSGPFADVRFTHHTDQDSALVVARNVGYPDQQYYAEYWRPGRMRAYFEWDQIPIFYSGQTETPYSQTGNGTLVLPDAPRQAAQAGGSLGLYAPLEQRLETRSRRDTFRLALLYSLTRSLDLQASVTSYSRQGNQPWSMSFGFSEAIEVPVPVDQRQTDVSASLDWSHPNRMLRLAWDGSWFTDNVQSYDSSPSLTIDNPLRFTNVVNTPAQGRMALPPDDTSQTVTAAGMTKLPGRSQLSADVSVGDWRQNDPLLPITINTALPQLTLDRSTGDLDVRRTSGYVSFTSRPSDALFFDAHYRLYDFANQSPVFTMTQLAAYDQALASEDNPTLWNHRRQDADASVTYSGWAPASLSAGYELEHNNQNDRLFGVTNDNGVRASVDTTTLGRLTLHGIYEHTRRRGSDEDPTVLTDAGDPPDLERYDIANRTRDELTAMAQVMVTSAVAATASIGASRNQYSDAMFGLQHDSSQSYTFGVDLTPKAAITADIAYGLQKYSALQQSHQTTAAVANFNDPTLNWSNDEGSTVNYVTANVTLLKVIPKTEIALGYDYNRSNDQYTYTVGSAIGPVAQWTPIIYEWQELHADARYFFRARWAASASYLFGRFRVNDFAFAPPIIDSPIQPGGLLLGYGARPYTANVAWLHVGYFF